MYSIHLAAPGSRFLPPGAAEAAESSDVIRQDASLFGVFSVFSVISVISVIWGVSGFYGARRKAIV